MSQDRQTPEERREAAAIRRRWITLGEVLAVVGVVISGLALWNSYSERSADEAVRSAERAKASAVSHILLLKASGGGKQLALAAHDPAQAIQSQTLVFPSALGVAAVETVIEPRIEAGWIRQAVKRARDVEEKEKRPAGDARIPVAITTRFASGGESLTDTAIYDVGYKADGGGLLGGLDVDLRGLSLVERVRPATARKRLDALWAARH
jgi:hypothetical protein